jgi:D-arginine dehydrogenase
MDLREALAGNSRAAPLQELKRPQLERLVPGIREGWDYAVFDSSCADIDVAGLHQACLAEFRRRGGTIAQSTSLRAAQRSAGKWLIEAGNDRLTAGTIVNAAGAWADAVASLCGVAELGLQPYRRSIAQLRVGQRGLKDLPLINDALERFYFKGESDNRVWVSPHDEVLSDPCDAAPEEIDVATAIDRFESVVDWPVERVERAWAGLRTFAVDRLPVYGFDSRQPRFFWCVGQGGFGIQTSPAAAHLAASLVLDDASDPLVAHIDPATFSPDRFNR